MIYNHLQAALVLLCNAQNLGRRWSILLKGQSVFLTGHPTAKPAEPNH